ncbi:MAG: DUF5110 domain-containing protein, partial [Acidobacteriota bacterium]|nr:DUF5110 domain-containing protein [Acidobacteriota bacterium]
YNLDDQFMIGNDLLVAPIVKPDVTQRLVYLPKGVWYDYWTSKKYEGGGMIRVEAPLETVPMFVRGGAIIPVGPEMNYVGEKPSDPITLAIYPDEKGSATTSLYEDDGVTPDYLQGTFRRTTVSTRQNGGTYMVTLSAPEGTYKPGPRKFNFVIKSERSAGQMKTIADDGSAQTIEIK